jgi:hypothetical protein
MAVTTDARGSVAYCHRCGYVDARNHDEARATARHDFLPMRTTHMTAKPGVLDWSTRAQAIWDRTQSLRSTLGETYLLSRGCVLPPRDCHLRFLPSTDKHPPSLCACVSDAITAAPISLHFTRLRADGLGKAGTTRDKLLLAGHRKKGGCIRLWPNDSVTHGLALAEGLESSLAAAHAFTPIWATVDAGNLARFPVLAGIDALTIYADHDERGIEAADACAERWREAGRHVRVRVPKNAGEDAADIAQRMVMQ